MLTHITLGTNDLERARVFYDKVLEPLELKRLFSVEQASGWGRETPQFIALRPRNGEAAAAGNGLTVGFAAPSRGAEKEFHRIALSLGAVDEGAPATNQRHTFRRTGNSQRRT